MLFRDYLLHILDHFDDIEPFPRCMINIEEEALAFVASHDESVSGYSMIGHLITGDDKGNMISQIVTANNKIGKHTVVMHELLSLVLAVAHSFSVLRLLPAEALKTITRVVLPGDSTIIVTFFNPRVRLTSVLVRNAVFQVKSVARDIINICPQATVHLTWIEGAINPSYLNSKLHLRPIMAGNSNMYSYGPTIYLDEAQLIANTYLRIDGKGM